MLRFKYGINPETLSEYEFIKLSQEYSYVRETEKAILKDAFMEVLEKAGIIKKD